MCSHGSCANTLLWVSVLIRCGCVCRKDSIFCCFISLHIRSMWETTVMHKQVSGWTVNFGPNFPESPFLELKSTKPPPPFGKTSDLGWPKFTPEYPPHTTFWKTSDLGWQKFTHEIPPSPISENFRFGMCLLRNTPPHWKLQIWDDQSLLRNTPPLVKIVREPKSESFRIPRVTTCGDFIQPG